MNKKTIRDIRISGKRVLMRVDFNVPLEYGSVRDDTRIRAALQSIEYILDHGGSLILMSHLGRPGGKVKSDLSLRPVADRLAKLLERDVRFAPDCVGEEVKAMVDSMTAGDILMLVNLRFHTEEEGKEIEPSRQKAFAEQLAALGDVYIDDAFGTAHREHASMAGVTEFMDHSVAGFLLEREIEYLGNALANPERPFVAIIGGAKISGKIDVIISLADKADAIVIGGGLAYTFYQAKGIPVGKSMVEEDRIKVAAKTLKYLGKKKCRILLPVDHVVANAPSDDTNVKIVGEGEIEDGWMALDIGPKTIELFAAEIAKAKTVFWNGPMGYFEKAPFADGTMAVCKAVAETDCVSIIGGGDSVRAVKQSGLAARMSHISTGGGASLEFLEGRALPGIIALDDK